MEAADVERFQALVAFEWTHELTCAVGRQALHWSKRSAREASQRNSNAAQSGWLIPRFDGETILQELGGGLWDKFLAGMPRASLFLHWLKRLRDGSSCVRNRRQAGVILRSRGYEG